MDDESMKDQMEKDRLVWEKIEQELFARREAERIANELEAQALLPIIEAERIKPSKIDILNNRIVELESILDIMLGGERIE